MKLTDDIIKKFGADKLLHFFNIGICFPLWIIHRTRCRLDYSYYYHTPICMEGI